jgi:hypothetical protein
MAVTGVRYALPRYSLAFLRDLVRPQSLLKNAVVGHEIEQGLKSLHENLGWVIKDILQGLKPRPFYLALTARLKPCPFKARLRLDKSGKPLQFSRRH